MKPHPFFLTIALTLVLGLAVDSATAQSTETAAQESDTQNDQSMTPWNDPDDPYVIRLNRDDPTTTEWNSRNSGRDPNRAPGPIDLHRYSGGTVYDAFPTFLSMPVAFTPEDLKAGDIDVAIVGATTDMNAIPGTRWAANFLRGYLTSSATYYTARGDGKQERVKHVLPVDQYVRSSLHEVNIVDYGNMKAHPYSGEKSVEEIRSVLGEILDGDAMPMMVGGSHDSQYGLYMAAADKFGKGNFGVVHFDSHIDAFPTGYGYYVHNGNGIYQGLERGLFKGDDLIQVGMTSIGPNDELLNWAKAKGVRYHYQAEIERDGWEAVMRRVIEESKRFENLVVTVDIDIMDQKDVPGTGGREPDGPTASEMMKMMRALGIQNNVVMVEICEYNPMLDSRAFQTATVVRQLMLHFLYGKAAAMRGIADPFYYHPEMVDDGR